MRRSLYSRRSISLWVLIASLLILLGQRIGWLDSPAPAVKVNQQGFYRVVKFEDGDTIAVELSGKKETVRLIGVDTPETHDPRKAVQCFGVAAAQFTKNIIGINSVRLENDALSANRDRYNRLLRYVYLPNGSLVNAEIIKQGYGFAYLNFPFTKSDQFRKYELEARASQKGLWNSCDPQPNQSGGYTSNDAQ